MTWVQNRTTVGDVNEWGDLKGLGEAQRNRTINIKTVDTHLPRRARDKTSPPYNIMINDMQDMTTPFITSMSRFLSPNPRLSISSCIIVL